MYSNVFVVRCVSVRIHTDIQAQTGPNVAMQGRQRRVCVCVEMHRHTHTRKRKHTHSCHSRTWTSKYVAVTDGTVAKASTVHTPESELQGVACAVDPVSTVGVVY